MCTCGLVRAMDTAGTLRAISVRRAYNSMCFVVTQSHALYTMRGNFAGNYGRNGLEMGARVRIRVGGI